MPANFLNRQPLPSDVFDIELDEADPDKLVDTITRMEPSFEGINLEDIKAPECFYIERKLRERLKIPVFHDDQHGTVIVAAAAILNALKLVGKNITEVKLVASGDDRRDIFVGLSAAGVVKPAMVVSMACDPITLAMANPNPEISPEEALTARADAIIGTGRSDYPSQVNEHRDMDGPDLIMAFDAQTLVDDVRRRTRQQQRAGEYVDKWCERAKRRQPGIELFFLLRLSSVAPTSSAPRKMNGKHRTLAPDAFRRWPVPDRHRARHA